MATAPRPGVGRRAESAALSITIKVDEVAYTLWPGELTAADSSALRRATREQWGVPVSIQRLLSSVLAGTDDTIEPDIDAVAMVVWLARRQTGDPVTLDVVMASITFDSSFEIDNERQEDPDPLGSSAEISGGASRRSHSTSVSDGNTSR